VRRLVAAVRRLVAAAAVAEQLDAVAVDDPVVMW